MNRYRTLINSNKQTLTLLYSIYVVLCILMIVTAYSVLFDTQSYYDAWDNIKEGRIDWIRTPLYPVFVGLIRDLVGQYYLVATCIIQAIVFGLTIKLFYRTALMLTHSCNVSFWVTLWYVISPTTSDWAGLIMTESLSISLVTCMIYLMAKLWIKGLQWRDIILLGIVLSLLIFIRPSFLYLIPCALVFCVLVYRRWHKHGALLVASVVTPSLVMVIYCMCFNSTYGIVSPSAVGVINKGMILTQSGLSELPYIDNASMREEIESLMSVDDKGVRYNCLCEMAQKYGIEQLGSAVDGYLIHYPANYLDRMINRSYFFYSSPAYIYTLPSKVLSFAAIHARDSITITLLYLLFVVLGIKRGERSLFSILLLLIVLGNFVLTWIGADSDYYRLMASVSPVFMIFVAQMCSAFKFKGLFVSIE